MITGCDNDGWIRRLGTGSKVLPWIHRTCVIFDIHIVLVIVFIAFNHEGQRYMSHVSGTYGRAFIYSREAQYDIVNYHCPRQLLRTPGLSTLGMRIERSTSREL